MSKDGAVFLDRKWDEGISRGCAVNSMRDYKVLWFSMHALNMKTVSKDRYTLKYKAPPSLPAQPLVPILTFSSLILLLFKFPLLPMKRHWRLLTIISTADKCKLYGHLSTSAWQHWGLVIGCSHTKCFIVGRQVACHMLPQTQMYKELQTNGWLVGHEGDIAGKYCRHQRVPDAGWGFKKLGLMGCYGLLHFSYNYYSLPCLTEYDYCITLKIRWLG